LEILQDTSKEVYVAMNGNTVTGFLVLQMEGAFIGYIQSIGVLGEWRRRGIGSRLLQYAENRIFKETTNVFICVLSFNHRALELYRRLGYEIIGELKDYIVSGHSEILLRKTLGPLVG
jgi:ribosomal protein S18 acetylase RimI-like enzyme